MWKSWKMWPSVKGQKCTSVDSDSLTWVHLMKFSQVICNYYKYVKELRKKDLNGVRDEEFHQINENI